MSFDVCHDCGGASDWADAIRLGLAWGVPTVLWVLYRQQPKGTAALSVIAVLLGWAVGGAATYSAFDLGLIDVEEPVQREIIALTVKGGILSALGIRAYGWVRNRRALFPVSDLTLG